MARLSIAACALAAWLAASGSAAATSGWGCFRVVGVASSDVLNMRFGPSASSGLVGTIDPQSHGIIALDERGVLDTLAEAVAAEQARCLPASRTLQSRWCHVTHFTGAGTTTGWVSRRFLDRLECP